MTTVDDARATLRDRTITALDPQTGEQLERTVLEDVAANADATQSWAWRIEEVDGDAFIISAAPNPHHRGEQPPVASHATDGHLYVTDDGMLQRVTPNVVAAAAIPLDADQAAAAMAALRDSHDDARRPRGLYPLAPAEAAELDVTVSRDDSMAMALVEYELRDVDARWAGEAADEKKSPVRVQRFEPGTQPDDYQPRGEA